MSEPLDLICGCETNLADERGDFTILRVGRGSKCHAVGQVITATEANHIRYVNQEWDRAEAEWLEP